MTTLKRANILTSFSPLGGRFIALNDGVDTIHKDNEMIMIFKNVMKDIGYSGKGF